MLRLNIAIIGAGTAGLAAAALLAKQGHHIHLFEKATQLQAVGAGLLLQPAGLAVFDHLGILEHSLSLATRVTGLEGQLPGGRLLVNSHYRQADTQFYGLGIHRASLCHVLASKAAEYDQHIEWHLGHEVLQLKEQAQHIEVLGQQHEQSFHYRVDLVLLANGARSHLRPKAWEKFNQAYPWGAKWLIVPECDRMDRHILHQFYHGSRMMMGVMPTGSIPEKPEERLSSIFWSLPNTKMNHFLVNVQQQQKWLSQVHQRWPILAEWLAHVIPHPDDPRQWLSANYRDVVLDRLGQGRIGVLGDAAHAMSPQLGQGANMALLDAWAIAKALYHLQPESQLQTQQLWSQYHALRASSIGFYQFFSRVLTPFYQSNRIWTGPVRDVSFFAMNQLPYFQKHMAITISGLKRSALQHFSYADIAADFAKAAAFETKALKFD